MYQFEALQDMVASSADNTLSTVDEDLEDAMRTKFYKEIGDAHKEMERMMNTPGWNKAETEWQAEKDLCE